MTGVAVQDGTQPGGEPPSRRTTGRIWIAPLGSTWGSGEWSSIGQTGAGADYETADEIDSWPGRFGGSITITLAAMPPETIRLLFGLPRIERVARRCVAYGRDGHRIVYARRRPGTRRY